MKIERIKDIARKIHNKPSGDQVKGTASFKEEAGDNDPIPPMEDFTNPDAVTGKGQGDTIGALQDNSTY